MDIEVTHATYVLFYQVRFHFLFFWYQNAFKLNIQHPWASVLIIHSERFRFVMLQLFDP